MRYLLLCLLVGFSAAAWAEETTSHLDTIEKRAQTLEEEGKYDEYQKMIKEGYTFELPFYFQTGYFNKGNLLTLRPDDILVGDPITLPRPKVALFIFADFARPDFAKFMHKQYVTLRDQYVNTGKAILVFRPKPSKAGLYVYRVAQCTQPEKTQKFWEEIMDVQEKWANLVDPAEVVMPLAAKYGLDKDAYNDCLADTQAKTDTSQYMAAAQKGRLWRVPFMEVYVNQFYFPGLVDEEFFTNTVPRAIDKAYTNFKRKPPLGASGIFQPKPLDHALGDPNAPLKLIQYETPESKSGIVFYQTVLPLLKQKYIDTGKLYYVLRPYPWFGNGKHVAALVHCAPNDKFFQFHAHISNMNPQWLNPEGEWLDNPKAEGIVLAEARRFGMDPKALKDCADGDDMKTYIKDTEADLNRVFLAFYTPTYYLNEEELQGSMPPDAWDQKINFELEKIKTQEENAKKKEDILKQVQERLKELKEKEKAYMQGEKIEPQTP